MWKSAARLFSTAILAAGCATDPAGSGDEPPDYLALMPVGAPTPRPPAVLPALPGATTAVGVIPWQNGIVPYVLPAAMTAANTSVFLAACQEWKDATGITCQPRQNEPVYLTINPYSQECNSGVGSLDPAWPGVITMGLGSGCWSYGTVLHELGHAIGLMHEHQRTDRNSYLDFHLNLVQSGFLPNLAAVAGTGMQIGQPYDYFSISHYSANQGGSLISDLVLLPWDNSNHTDIVMGFGSRVSDGDAAKISALYARFNLHPAGRHTPIIDPSSVTLVSQQGGKTIVQITGQFLPSGNGITIAWHDKSYNTFDSATTIVSESATQIQFSVPTMDSNAVPTNLYADVTSARMPVWIRPFEAARRNGTEGAPVPANFPTTTGTATAGTRLAPAPVAASPVLNAASFEQGNRVAPGSWATIGGTNLAATTTIATAAGNSFPSQLAGTTVTLTSGAGSMTCPLLYVSPSQINFYIPDGAAIGPNQVTVSTNGAPTLTTSVRIFNVSPGVFTASQDGGGWAVGQAIWNDSSGAQKTAPLSTGSGLSAQAVPIDLGGARGDLYVALYATGIRGRSNQRNTYLLIDGVIAPVTFADTQRDFVGLDQINAVVPPALAGRGKVRAYLIADGVASEPIDLQFK